MTTTDVILRINDAIRTGDQFDLETLAMTCPVFRATRKSSLFFFCLSSFGGVSNGRRRGAIK